jgi:nucleoside-diphosphate-sugar epimerase
VYAVRVLVTGPTGFIGAQVVRVLVDQGCEVHGVVRPDSDRRRIERLLPKIGIIPVDLYDGEAVRVQLEKLRPDLCLHLAWTTEPGKYLRSLDNVRLLQASLQLATGLAAAGCTRFVGVGTCFEYDTDAGYLSEQTPTRPRTLYAAAKTSLATILEQLQSVTGMQSAWIRLFYQYGPYEDERRLVPSVISPLLRGQVAAVGPGTQIRDYLHVEDVARAIWAVAQERGLTGPVNVGSGQPVSVREVVTTIGDLIGRADRIAWGAGPADPADPPFICANTARLRRHTAWTPRYGLAEGLRLTVDWWREQLARR